MDFLQKGATTIKIVGLLPPAEVTPLRLKYITMTCTKHTHILSQAHRLWSNLYKCINLYRNKQIYYSNSYWFVFKITGKSPSVWYVCHTSPSKWVCFWNIGVPQNGSVFGTLAPLKIGLFQNPRHTHLGIN